ncbi:MAG: ABC transporter permease [Phycisphaerae bacterium]|nr:ABC transporter permease [Phycisphaerae bacterium]
MADAGVETAPGGGSRVVTVIRPRRGWRGVDFGELWRQRGLLYYLVWRDIKVRYKQTVIGAGWAVLQPFCSMVIFSIIFGSFAGIPSDGAPYPLFVYAGLLPWLLFANAVSTASQSLVGQAHLVKKVYFPRLYVPAANIGLGLVDFTLSLCVYAGIMLWFAYPPGWGVLLLPLLVLMTVLAALGTGVLLAGITVVYRDFRFVVPFMVQVWMYLSPVVYPLTIVPERYHWIVRLNPLVGIIGGFRSALLNQPMDWAALGSAAVVTIVLLIVGLATFRRAERRFADIA